MFHNLLIKGAFLVHVELCYSYETLPTKSKQHQRLSSAEIPSDFKRDADRTDAPCQALEKASDTSQRMVWPKSSTGQVKPWDVVKGCERLRNGQKGGGQSQEG